MTIPSHDLQNQVIDLEIKISHQEIAIDELKNALFEQHGVIQNLQKDLKRLTGRLESVDSGLAIGPGNEKPPHY